MQKKWIWGSSKAKSYQNIDEYIVSLCISLKKYNVRPIHIMKLCNITKGKRDHYLYQRHFGEYLTIKEVKNILEKMKRQSKYANGFNRKCLKCKYRALIDYCNDCESCNKFKEIEGVG